MTYHVIPSEFYFNETTSITTLNGGALDVVYDSSTKKATINNYAVIDTSSPIITDNGIVFPLAAHVMIPPCGFQSFATLIDTAKAVPELSTLVSLIVKADLASILSGPGPFTVRANSFSFPLFRVWLIFFSLGVCAHKRRLCRFEPPG